MMEVDKKDKLAAARKKLNEYKLNRSGSSKPATVAASSNPADVPLFYQNINSQPSQFSIFNPSGGDNNTSTLFTPADISAIHASSNEFATPETPVQDSNEVWNDRNQVPMLATTHQSNVVLPIPFGSSPVAHVHLNESHSPDDGKSISTSSDTVLPAQADVEINPLVSLTGGNVSGFFNQIYPQHLQGLTQEGALSLNQSSTSLLNQEPIAFINSDSDEFHPSAPVVEDVYADNFNSQSIKTGIENVNSLDFDLLNVSNEAEDNKRDQIISPQFASSLFSTSSSSELDNIFSANILSPQTQADCTPSAEVEISAARIISETISSSERTKLEMQSVPQMSEPSMESNTTPAHFTPYSQPHHIENTNDIASSGVFVANTPSLASVSHEDVDVLSVNVQNTVLQPADNSSGEGPQLMVETESYQRQHSPQSFIMETGQGVQFDHPNQPQQQIVQPTVSSNGGEFYQQMKSMQEALELQTEELRRENSYLLSRQNELTSRIEESEKLAHEFKLEKDRVKEEAMTSSQALRARINSLCEENQRIVKNSTDVGVDLREKHEEKTRQLEEMQKAVIIVSQSKMEFAGRLDHELERVKDLQNVLRERDDEIANLRAAKRELEEKLKQEQQKDAIIHQLQDQQRHYQVQCETLQRELEELRKRQSMHESVQMNPNQHDGRVSGSQHEGSLGEQVHRENAHDQHECSSSHLKHDQSCSHDHPAGVDSSGKILETRSIPHVHSSSCSHDNKENLSHEHDDQVNTQEHNGHHHHDHAHEGHDHHDHAHEGHHHHDHAHEGHHHDHSHEGEHVDIVARRGPTDEVTELKKTLHRLEWENSTYRNELDVLAVDAKQKRSYEEKCSGLETENDRLRREIEQLEHVVIQLQGENDTIGDYVTLYQTQRMALRECAKEKDAQLELLAKEREMLLHRLSELTALVKEIRDSKSEASSQCADDHIHRSEEFSTPTPNNKRQIEGKIRNLLSEISSSTLIENFHPCAVCSGRLMTV